MATRSGGPCRMPPCLSGTWPWFSVMHVLDDFLSVITLVNRPPSLCLARSNTASHPSQHVLAAACLSLPYCRSLWPLAVCLLARHPPLW